MARPTSAGGLRERIGRELSPAFRDSEFDKKVYDLLRAEAGEDATRVNRMFLKGGWPTEALNTCVIRNIAQLLAWSLNPKAVRALLLGQRLALELARARKRLSLMLADDAVAMERFDDAASAIRADHRVLLHRDLSVESPPRARDPRWGEVLSLEIAEGELSGGLGRQRLAYLYIALGEDAMAEEHVAATLQHTPGDALARVLQAQLALRAVARLASNAAH